MLFIVCKSISAQYGDKKFYLVDSVKPELLDDADRYDLDSLLKIYHSSANDTVKIKVLHGLTKLNDDRLWVAYNNILLQEVKAYLDGVKKTNADKKFLSIYYGSALYNLNSHFSRTNEEDSAKKYLELCLYYYEKADYKRGLCDANVAYGVYYNRMGDYNAALPYYQKALKIAESSGYKKGIGRAQVCIGTVYRDLDQFDKAKEAFMKGMTIWEELGKKDEVAETWNYLGMTYKWSGDTANAEMAYSKSLQMNEELNNLYGIAAAKLNLGVIYQNREEFDKAIANYLQSLEIFRRIESTNGESYTLNSLAIAYNLMGQHEKALKYALESHELCLKMGYPESLINSSQVLYDTYRRLGKYKEAFEMKEYYHTLKDSVMDVENQKKALTTQLEFESKEKMMKLEKAREEENLRTEEEKKQQRIIIIAVVVCLLIVIVFTAFLFNRFKIIKKQKGIIEEQNHIVTEKNKEILDSISYAKRLQEAILPADMQVKKQLPDSFIYYRPKDIVAGDFYWMEAIRNDHSGKTTVWIAAADSTGHGVPGAMVSVVCSNALNRTVLEFGLREPGEILDKAREIVLETFSRSNMDVKDGMDISLVSIEYNTDEICNVKWAGANNPLWYISEGALHELKADKQPVGKTESPKPFTTHNLQLMRGALLYLFTDGFADQFGGPKGKKYKYKPFGEFLVSMKDEAMSMQSDKLNLEFNSWRADLEQIDDVCVIGIRL